ncbi:FBP domain-containing protein [Pedococcus sp. KACC 23699]|uniref:FBP domain-containing protein n=1 Tax=Pedococcus sp. KACC 23699 TaxID=3149228 RepID=A0AAU7JQ83_9MICO
MQELTETEIRACFVNATKGESKRLALPKDLATLPWDDLDFLGWRDPAAPQRAYVVASTGGVTTGVALRLADSTAGRRRRNMCAVCLTTHPGDGVSLMTARKAGRSGQQGNSVGTYLCSDLACSLYVRGLRSAGPGSRLQESLSLEDQSERLVSRLQAFLDGVARES